MSAKGEIRVLIAASGSGGHLFPAIFIAEAIKAEAAPDGVEVVFVGSGRPLESKLLDPRGYTRYEVQLKGITGRGLKGLFEFVFAAPRAFGAVWQILSQFRPGVVIGVGGYASFLPVMVARLRGIPTVIHEAELSPGLANKVLAIFTSKITAAFSELDLNRGKQVYTGHPLRPELNGVQKPMPDKGPPRNILVLGGSQGARALDQGMVEILPLLKEHSVEVHHQTRPENMERIQRSYHDAGVSAVVTSFFSDMVSEYSWSDIIISRSGAAAINEIDFVGRPAVFVPLPTPQGGHQLKNARHVASKGRAVVVEEGSGFSERLGKELRQLLRPDLYSALISANIAPPKSDAAKLIAAEVLKLLRLKGAK